MTVAVANVELTNTFDQWRVRTNQIAATLSTLAVTVNSNAAVGNAAIVGSFTSNVINTPVLGGGTTGAASNLAIVTNTSFSAITTYAANVVMSSTPGVVNDLGTQSNIRIAGANTTHKFLVGYSNNSVGFETILEVLRVSDLLDMNVQSYGTTNTVTSNAISSNGSILQYDVALSRWVVGRFGFDVAANGNIGLGETAGAFKLGVTGTMRVTGNTVIGANLINTNTATSRVAVNRGTADATLHVGGSVFVDGDVTTSYTSDGTFKHHVMPLKSSHVEQVVRALKPVSFYWDQEALKGHSMIGPKPEGVDIGLIAQDVQRVLPQAVITRPDGTLGISYERIVPYLLAHLQILEQRLEVALGE